MHTHTHTHTHTLTATAIHKWFDHNPNFNITKSKVWPRIFKLAFRTAKDNKVQYFQNRSIHTIIPHSKWLHNIKSKNID